MRMHAGYRACGGTGIFSGARTSAPRSEVLIANVDGRFLSEATEILLLRRTVIWRADTIREKPRMTPRTAIAQIAKMIGQELESGAGPRACGVA